MKEKIYTPQTRSKYWWLWPEFNIEKDAYDIVKMGLGFLVLSGALNGGISIYKYFTSGDFENLVIGLILVGIYSLLGYGIFKMSKAAATITLILIMGLWLVDIITSEKVSGLPFLFMWCLFQTNRAIYWYRGKKVNR